VATAGASPEPVHGSGAPAGDRPGGGCDGLRPDAATRREEELRAGQMLQLVLDTVPERVFWKDRNSVFVGCNAAFARDAGLDDPADLIGRTDDDMVWRDNAARYRADDREVMDSGVAKVSYEEPQIRADGTESWLRTSKLPLRDAGGTVMGILCTYEDITDQKRAEQALRRSEQFLDSIVDNIPNMIFVKDAVDLRFVLFNRAGEELMGRSRHELLGQSDFDLNPADEAGFYAATDREVLEGGRLVDITEEDHSAGPLGRRVLHTRKIPILDESGRALYLLGISEDITDRKQAEEALRQSEERYRHIIESITDYTFSVVVNDGEMASPIHGPGSVAVTGFTPDELSRDPVLWREIVFPADRPLLAEQTRQLLAGEQVRPLEHRIVRKDGVVRWVRNTLVPRFDRSGALVAYDALIADVTERRLLQEQLLEAQKMEGIGRLAGGVAHDFNNLLTAILGYLEMARLDMPDDLGPDHALRSDLAEVAAASQRAASLTRQLLTFASKQLVAPERLDLSALVADLLKMLRPLLGEDVVVETDLEPEPATIEADPGQIQQLLVNLAVNARDAMPDGGRFVIETATEDVTEAFAAEHPGMSAGRHVSLSVTDTGCGMTDEVRSHLFEPFFTTKERGKGTGLGLATCHGIVHKIGGQILVFSDLGRGTTFHILLPCVAGKADARPVATENAPAPVGNETILLVEDEPVVRRLAVLGLRFRGYTVLEAADGAEAIEIAQGNLGRIDLVVSDVVMPGLSGPELLKRLSTITPTARRLLVSGHAEEAVLPGGPREVDAEFLPKPFTPDRLARKIREVLDAAE
jgi:two-component system, cell cycle sensor histidine kinase and response regulator CckA